MVNFLCIWKISKLKKRRFQKIWRSLGFRFANFILGLWKRVALLPDDFTQMSWLHVRALLVMSCQEVVLQMFFMCCEMDAWRCWCMDDMIHEDRVLVLKQYNTQMMTLNLFINERTLSSSWKELESLRGKQQQNIRLCCLELKKLAPY